MHHEAPRHFHAATSEDDAVFDYHPGLQESLAILCDGLGAGTETAPLSVDEVARIMGSDKQVRSACLEFLDAQEDYEAARSLKNKLAWTIIDQLSAQLAAKSDKA